MQESSESYGHVRLSLRAVLAAQYSFDGCMLLIHHTSALAYIAGGGDTSLI